MPQAGRSTQSTLGVTMKRRKDHWPRWAKIAATAIYFGFAFSACAAIFALALSYAVDWSDLLHISSVFGVFGALYGNVAALDSSSGISYGNHPLLRTIVSAILGGLLAFLINAFAPLGLLIGLGAGAVLGWFGWRWARYVTF